MAVTKKAAAKKTTSKSQTTVTTAKKQSPKKQSTTMKKKSAAPAGKQAAKRSSTPKQSAAKRPAAKKATATKATATKATATKATATKATGAKRPAATATKQSSSKQAATKKQAASKRAAPAATKQAVSKQSAAKRPAASTSTAKQTTAKRSIAAPTQSTPAKRHATPPAPAPVTAAASDTGGELPAPRGVTKDGVSYTKDFDVKFLKAQRDFLNEARTKLFGQATRLEDEANSLIEEGEMGDVQFDDESGEGDTMVVERERDLALSAQARQTIADIDAALERIGNGTYGYSEASGRPIPRERLEAIPWASELVEEKVGGIGRR